MIADEVIKPRVLIETVKVSTSSHRAELGTPRTREPMIRLRNLEKFYRTSAGFTHVLRQIDLDIAEGEFVRILGTSGAGKSTLLKILGMYDHVWEGEFFFSGFPVHRFGPKERSTLNNCLVGFVFEEVHLNDGLTVAEDIDIRLTNRNLSISDRQSVVSDALDRFNIAGARDLYPEQLSGEQQQLVAIARAIIAKPRLILADEPIGNLRYNWGREIMKLFKKLNREGATIVQATLSEDNATYGNRIVRLKNGRMER
jgi:ABC-type lipoprotein export system ATPase subunit